MVEQLEKTINSFLQQKISFSVNGKTIKSGKLILFCIKDFYLVFTLTVNQSKKIFEIPYPYSFASETKKITLNYSTKTLCHDVEEIKYHAKLLAPRKPNKFFNTYAELAIIEEVL